METDKQFYKLFKAAPETLKSLLKIDSPAPYKLRSETLKDISRSTDGCFESEDGPTYIIEFQGYRDSGIYARTVQTMSTYQLQHSGRPVLGVIVFLSPRFDPKTSPWHEISRSGLPALQVLYLKEIMAGLAVREPDHPLLVVFQPYLAKNIDILQKEAASCHLKLRESKLEDSVKKVFLEVFESWLLIRFKKTTKEELFAMLGIMGSIEESVAYQEIKQEGRDEGLKEGLKEGRDEGKAEILLRFFNKKFGDPPDWFRNQIKNTRNGDLDAWADLIFEAQTVDQVLQAGSIHK